MRARVTWIGTLSAATAAAAGMTWMAAVPAEGRGQDTVQDGAGLRFDHGQGRVVGPSERLADRLGLELASATMDQPEYWPDEPVRVRILMPDRPRAKVEITWQKRDATPRREAVRLDSRGVAVAELAGGEGERLELGEYRVEVESEDGERTDDASFTVVEGSLGALSLAHPFDEITERDELSAKGGAWMLHNPSGSGHRWNNELIVKNELRHHDSPYEGEIEIIPLCMLPVCDGRQAAPSETLEVDDGVFEVAMDVSGHSGPFHLELVTGDGTLRVPLEGSGHVEREMVEVSQGMGYRHRAGIAPYEDTEKVPGRDLYVERGEKREDDPFSLSSVVAEGGDVDIEIERDLRGAGAYVWSPTEAGDFEAERLDVGSRLRAGERVRAPVFGPVSVVAFGGYDGEEPVEGWAMVFVPSALAVDVNAPDSIAPGEDMEIDVRVTSGGDGIATSGVLEVYDSRVAARSPARPLSSALGDSVRDAARPMSRWRDQLEPLRERTRPEPSPPRAPGPDAEDDASGAVRARGSADVAAAGGTRARRSSGSPDRDRRDSSSMDAPPGAEDEGAIREGEEKVVAAERIETGPNGRARVRINAPPQTGRLVARVVAVDGLDHAEGEARISSGADAYVEIEHPRAFVPGAELELPVTAVNRLDEPVVVSARGAGLGGGLRARVGAGDTRRLSLPWVGRESGPIELKIADPEGAIVDRRVVSTEDVMDQPATLTRVELGGGAIEIAEDETAVVYPGPGHLLGGMARHAETTLRSWLPHAEALSAQVAVRATLLAASERDLLPVGSTESGIRSELLTSVRHLRERFLDTDTGLARPYLNLDPDPLWSAWVAENLHSARRSLARAPELENELGETAETIEDAASRIDDALAARGLGARDLDGYDPRAEGRRVVPVDLDGEVVHLPLTDGAVRRFFVEEIAPHLDPHASELAVVLGRAFDEYRFLRAMERAGKLQYLAEGAIALWDEGGEAREEARELFRAASRGMIAAREPGLLEGPALTGGLYSRPMALVRYLELLLRMDEDERARGGSIAARAGGGLSPQTLEYGERIGEGGSATIQVPSGAAVRIDRETRVALDDAPAERCAGVSVSSRRLEIGERARLEIALDDDRDPLEYYAVLAVPSSVSIAQTEDIREDYAGDRLHGHQSLGASQTRAIASPFRGSRRMGIQIEGALSGRSEGVVLIRHMRDEERACTVAIPEIRVR